MTTRYPVEKETGRTREQIEELPPIERGLEEDRYGVVKFIGVDPANPESTHCRVWLEESPTGPVLHIQQRAGRPLGVRFINE